MKQDTIQNDTIEARPLPQWLTKQRDGLNTYQPQKLEMKEDYSLQISLISTGFTVLIVVVLLTVYFLRRNKNKM